MELAGGTLTVRQEQTCSFASGGGAAREEALSGAVRSVPALPWRTPGWDNRLAQSQPPLPLWLCPEGRPVKAGGQCGHGTAQ